MVRIMLDALRVEPGHRVLEVGGGSGWHAALLAWLAAPGGSVVSVERHEALATRAREAVRALDASLPATFVVGDGSLGLPERAPFDRISVAAAGPAIPPPLLAQLAPGGVLVAPVGPPEDQTLVRARKDAGGDAAYEDLGPVRFVPLVGEYGF
jgi:protein-L-isoaspartate(D-aspartate) O-methyltransferase